MSRWRLISSLRQNCPIPPKGGMAIQGLLDDKTVLLEYALGEDASFLFAVTKSGSLTARLPAASSLSHRVGRLRQATSRPSRPALSNYLLYAGSLYQDLVQPAEKLLAGKRTLIIVPDSSLHYLPFEVLLQSDSGRATRTDLRQLPYLVRDYAISTVPSASVLASLQNQPEEKSGPGKIFPAYADPVYGRNQPAETNPVRAAVRSAFGGGKPWKLERLWQSRPEVEHIAKLFPAEETDLFLGEQASEENVNARGQISQHRFVHSATQGLLNEDKPQFSVLILSLPQEKDPRPKTRDPRPQTSDFGSQQSEIRNPKSEID